jgi:signal transduction histidine kinase
MSERGTALGLLAIGTVAGLLLVALLDRYTATALPEPLLTIATAQRSLAPPDDPPSPDDPGWVPVSLPDTAPLRVGVERQHAWYRLRVRLPPDDDRLWAMMFERPHAAVKVWVGDALLADSGVERVALPEYRHEVRYNVPRALAGDGEFEMTVLAVTRSHAAGLRRVWFGDSAATATYKQVRNSVEKAGPRQAVLVIVVLALILAAVQAARPRETAFGWFAAALMLWAAHAGLSLSSTPLLDSAILSRPTLVATLLGFTVCGVMFVHRFAGVSAPRTERLVLATAMVGALLAYAGAWLSALLAAPRLLDLLLLGLLVPTALALGALIVWRLLQAQFRPSVPADLRALLALSAILFVIGVRDWLVDVGVLGDWQSIAYLPFAAPLVFLVFGALLWRRHVEALTVAEALNRELGQKVAEKAAEAQATWQRLAVAEADRARMEERERWMRDMHDGVGGYLVEAMALADRGGGSAELKEVLQGCLEELRIMFDAGERGSLPLGVALGRLRERLAPRLRALGISLEWNFLEMPELPVLSSEASLHVLRILQELVANAIKHAHARCITVHCTREANGWLVLEVVDDGAGFAPPPDHAGRGIANLVRRAQALDGELHWRVVGSGGTASRLRFPPPMSVAEDADPACLITADR